MGKITHQSVDSDMRRYQNIKTDLDDVKSSLAEKAQQTDSMFIKVNETSVLPVDFQPTLPFKLIFDPQLNVSHDWDLNQFKTGADTQIWVNRSTGNDTTGTGASGAPFQTMGKAWTYIQTLTWTKAVINATGNFKRGDCPSGWNIPAGKTLCIVGDGATTFYSDKANLLTWTADGTSYKASRSSCFNAIDLTVTPDSNGFYKPLIQATSIADCQATAGSWYSDGTFVWVHTFDNRQPDINFELVIFNTALEFTLNDNSVVYLEGFTKRGNISVNGGTGKGRVVRKSVKHYGGAGTQSNGFDVDDVNDAYSFDCITAYNADDGNNYHYANTTTPRSKLMFESGCISYENGKDTGDQASTCHEGVSNIRINGTYTGKTGTAITDVQNCDTVILGCKLTATVAEAVNVWDSGSRLTMVNTTAYTQPPYNSIKALNARLRRNFINQDVNITQAVLV